MKVYAITHGSYSDYTLDALIAGPDDLDLPALHAAFSAILDNGWDAAVRRFQAGIGPRWYEDPVYRAALAAHRDWLACQYWADGGFAAWLAREHGCRVLPYCEFIQDKEHDGRPSIAAAWYAERGATQAVEVSP